MEHVRVLVLLATVAYSQACMRGMAVYRRDDPDLGVVYEYHNTTAPHPGGQLERIDGTNTNLSVPTFVSGLTDVHDLTGTAVLRLCLVTQPWARKTTHVLILSDPCEDLRQYTDQPDLAIIRQINYTNAPLPGQVDLVPFSFEIVPMQASICRGHAGVIYSTVTTADPFCNSGHENLQQFSFGGYLSAACPVFCPLISSDGILTIRYEHQPGVIGVTAFYGCAAGYSIVSGATSQTCNTSTSGLWKDELPTCERVYCDLPPTVPHGEYVYVEEDDVLQRSTVRLQCHRGFIATFEETLICTRDGWTDHNGYCQRLSCGTPPVVEHGMYVDYLGQPSEYESTVILECEEGFIPSDPQPILTCLATARWSTQHFRCRTPHCLDPGVPSNGRRIGSDFSDDAIVQFVCNEGYILIGASLVTCLFGQWSAEPPQCIAVDCPELPQIENGVWFWDTYNRGRVQFWCLPGYELNGQSFSVCYDGQWRSTLPTCNACEIGYYKEGLNSNGCRRCPERSSTESTATGSREGCICQPGTRPSDDGSSCQDIGCPPYPPIDNGRREWRVYDWGLAIAFDCFPGYEITGHYFSVCQDDDTWSDSEISTTCEPCPMGYFKTGVNNASCTLCPENMVTSTEASAECFCAPDYRPAEDGDGCELLQCPYVDPPNNGAVTISGLTPGHRAEFTCSTGYSLDGETTIQCLHSGLWSDATPQCLQLACPQLEHPSNGFMLVTNDDHTIGTVAVFRCDPGYTLLGDETLDCVEFEGRALWDAQEPICVED